MAETKSRRPRRIVIWTILAVVLIWIVGDFLYSRVIAYRIQRWEAGIQRDSAGVREGCQEYTLGTGDAALLLIHGINDSPAAYQKMAPVLAREGFSCRVMRLPGFAEPMDRYAKTSQEECLAAIAKEVGQLREEFEHVSIVAHSLGGALTIAYLTEHPKAVDRVVLIAPALAVSNVRSPLLPTRTWHSLAGWLLLFTRITETPFPIDARALEETDRPRQSPFTPRALMDATFAVIDRNRGRAGEFRTPMLMVLSKDDRVIDWRAAEEFYRKAASQEKQILFVDHSGHAITLDRAWHEVTLAIIDFVAEDSP